jgi:hypothetical protein
MDVAKVVEGYGKTLDDVGAALATSFGKSAQWGVAGFREEALVFLLAETMRRCDAHVLEYEPCFTDQRTRADLRWIEQDGRTSMLEAKWWWRNAHTLDSVLASVLAKPAFGSHDGNRYAVVFTIDATNAVETDVKHVWSPSGAGRWMEFLTPKGWRFIGCATTRSPFARTASPRETPIDGIFAAAFYQLTS